MQKFGGKMRKEKQLFWLLATLMIVIVTCAYAGEVKLTTYYPAPYGEYRRVTTRTLGVGDTNGDGSINSNDAPDPNTFPGNAWISGDARIGGSLNMGTSVPWSDVHIVGRMEPTIALDRFTDIGNGSASLVARESGGTPTAMTSTQNEDYLFYLEAQGYTGAAIGQYTPTARIEMTATQNWADTGAHGSRITFSTTANDALGMADMAERMRIDHDGDVGIGTIAPMGSLHIAKQNPSVSYLLLQSASNSSTFVPSAGITAQASRGTLDTPAATRSDDILFNLLCDGYGVGGFTTAAIIRSRATQNWTATAHGANIGFWTTPNDSVSPIERMKIDHNGNVGINTTSPATTARLEIASTTQGFLPPRMTTTQRNAITSPAEGLQIYNTTTHRIEYYNGSRWCFTLGIPDYDSGWIGWASTSGNSATRTVTHSLNTTNVLIDLQAQDTNSSPNAQINMGIWQVGGDYSDYGAGKYDTHRVIYWQKLTTTSIVLSWILDPGTNQAQVNEQVRLRMWKLE